MTPLLVAPEELARSAADAALVVQVTSAAVYRAAHPPGALHVAPGELVSGVPPATGRLPEVARLTALFRRLGYEPGRRVAVLDDEGGGWAGRLAWTLDVVGCEDWQYVDGGLHAWHAAGLPLTDRAPSVSPSAVEIVAGSEPVAETEDILTRLNDPDLLVWDCRSAEEHRGEKSGSARHGRIPGARHLDWLDLMDPARSLRLREDFAELLAKRGIDRRRQVVTHCQTHHRSGLAYMVARLAGFPRIRAYHGAWAEWGNRADTPIETGPPRPH